MGELVDLSAKREEQLTYWRCDCGCITHYMRSDGAVQCARCDHVFCGTDDPGFWKIPEGETREESENDPPERARVDVQEHAAALQEALRFVNAEGTAALVVVYESGTVSCWGKAFDSRSRRGWLRRKLETARKMLIGWEQYRD